MREGLHRFAALALLTLGITAAWAGAAMGEFYAVIVGIADYPGTGNDLSFTDDDALGVYQTLLSFPAWSPERIALLIDSAGTKANVRQSMQELTQGADADDLLFFYFSGHGTTGTDLPPLDEADGRDEYLCTYGNTLTDFVRDDELETWLAELPVGRIVIALDACFSGGAAKGVRGLGAGPAPREGDGFTADLVRADAKATVRDVNNLTRCLVVLAAADDHELAYEFGHPYNHGLFTYFLLEAMRGGGDLDGDGCTMAVECHEYLAPRVQSVSDLYGLGQHPQVYDGCPGGVSFLQANAPIVLFADPNLEAAIREAIAKPTGDILVSDLGALTFLDASGRGIAALEGMQHCTSLEVLDLAGNQISDLAPLAGLTSLQALFLPSNQIGDLSPLAALVGLKQLHLAGNMIQDLAPLAGLTALGDSLTSLSLELQGFVATPSENTELGTWEESLREDSSAPRAELGARADCDSPHLDLSENRISEIGSLVANPGLGGGDAVDLRTNLLDMAPGSADAAAVAALEARGALVCALPQRSEACWGEGVRTIDVSGTTNTLVRLGVSEDGTECYDLGVDKEVVPPPPGIAYTKAWFALGTECASRPMLREDIRTAVDCEQERTWTLHVEDQGSGSRVVLSWQDPLFDPIPECMNHVWLARWPTEFNVTRGEYELVTAGAPLDRIDMLTRGLYEYAKAGSFDHSGFTITVDCVSSVLECATLLGEGWHMVSIPGELRGPCEGDANDLSCALCDDLDVCRLYRYSPAGRRYLEAPGEVIRHQPGVGVWVNACGDVTDLCADVALMTEAVQVALETGWNQIGNPYDFAVAVADLRVTYGGSDVSLEQAQASGWVSASFYGYNPGLRDYIVQDLACGRLDAWTGYWILAYVDCVLTFAPIPAPPLSPALPLQLPKTPGLPSPPAPPAASAKAIEEVLSQLDVRNVPNPIRDERTTVFRVEGSTADLVEEIRVDIYDQNGTRVFTQRIAAKELVWHTVNDAGELLANGVYFYQVWVRIGEAWYPFGIRKLAVVR
jgi:hypothetical protein